uniref:Uncharacterized protein n=1 Tax=Anguilla anguilla TaxID=7936 RepID=A0A0E9XPT9_ANGAN
MPCNSRCHLKCSLITNCTVIVQLILDQRIKLLSLRTE